GSVVFVMGCLFFSAWGSSRSARKDLLHGIGLGCGSAHRNLKYQWHDHEEAHKAALFIRRGCNREIRTWASEAEPENSDIKSLCTSAQTPST
ncbi:hypothetical protein QBC42DRAFT_258784, partial [Cladorrhinum samala]